MKQWIVLGFWISTLQFTFAQGSLTPPGAPAATMKTLAQIEPRTPISSLPVTINLPGSYYLTTNLVGSSGANGITITADNVTIDLNGFSLTGVPGSLTGIRASSGKNATIHHGTVQNWSSSGIHLGNCSYSQVKDVAAIENGTGIATGQQGQAISCVVLSNSSTGLLLGPGAIARNCRVDFNNTGISAGNGCSLIECVVRTNNLIGIALDDSSLLRDCVVMGTVATNQSGIEGDDGNTLENVVITGNNGIGISVGDHNILKSCTVIRNGSWGIIAWQGTSVIGCTIATNAGTGIQLGAESLMRQCTVVANGSGATIGANCQVADNVVNRNLSHGLTTSTTGSRFEGNTIISNLQNGLFLFGTNNLAFRNNARGNALNNYSIASGNHYGPILVNPGAAFTNSNPWVNFQY